MKRLIETTSLRATILVASKGEVLLKSKSEGRSFTLKASEDLIQTAISLQYKEVDTIVRVEREPNGRILGGELLNIKEIRVAYVFSEWQKWHTENASEWDSEEVPTREEEE